MPRDAVLTDAGWVRFRPLLPSSSGGGGGRPFQNDRQAFEGIVCQHR
ncbi:hypothetical protein B8W73_10730 [Arthrobacter agilis]|nr:hypothetical protein B8W73_10730 [Arthrobacter agilis]